MIRIFLISCYLTGFFLSAKAQEMPDNMKTYTFVMLMKGENRTHDSTTVQQIQKAHLQHITKMAEEYDLNIAGPFLDNGFWRGILVFNSADTAAVRKIVEQDPAIKAGRLTYEIHPWMAQKGAALK